jgi:hypothetical protein
MKKRSPKSKVESPKSAAGRDRRQNGMLPEVHLQLAPAAARWIAETLYDQLDEIHDPLPETTKAQVREAIKFLYVHQRRWPRDRNRTKPLQLNQHAEGSRNR